MSGKDWMYCILRLDLSVESDSSVWKIETTTYDHSRNRNLVRSSTAQVFHRSINGALVSKPKRLGNWKCLKSKLHWQKEWNFKALCTETRARKQANQTDEIISVVEGRWGGLINSINSSYQPTATEASKISESWSIFEGKTWDMSSTSDGKSSNQGRHEMSSL